MDVWEKMYSHLFNAVTDAVELLERYVSGTVVADVTEHLKRKRLEQAIDLLKKAQQATEELYIEKAPDEPVLKLVLPQPRDGAPMTTCAVTGHRPWRFPWKSDEDDPRCAALKAALREWIIRLADEGVTGFLSGMAEGVDTWAAEIILELRRERPGLKLHCILPCKTQADKWSVAAQERYRAILERADSVVYVNREACKDCMLKRNRFLVDHADGLLAVSNDNPRSGTAATIHYAEKLGRRIMLLDPNNP